jgi:hypothetical protein
MTTLTIADLLKFSDFQMVGATICTLTPNPSIHRTLRDEAAQRL